MSVSLQTTLAVGAIVTGAYTVFGLTGFGASIMAMPLLAQLIALRVAVPMMLVFDLCAGSALAWLNRGVVERRELLRLLPFMLIGMLLGVTALVHAPERWLMLALGLFVLGYAGWSLLVPPGGRSISVAWAAPLGALGGVFTALYGTGGPIYTIYLARRIADKRALRASIGSFILMSAVIRLVLFTSAGLYAQGDALHLAAWLLPCAMLGLYTGSQLHRRLPAPRVAQAIWGLLIVGGSSLVLRALHG
jgi:uncharacterized membrane protein YfcA